MSTTPAVPSLLPHNPLDSLGAPWDESISQLQPQPGGQALGGHALPSSLEATPTLPVPADCWPLVRQAVLEVHAEHLGEVLRVSGHSLVHTLRLSPAPAPAPRGPYPPPHPHPPCWAEGKLPLLPMLPSDSAARGRFPGHSGGGRCPSQGCRHLQRLLPPLSRHPRSFAAQPAAQASGRLLLHAAKSLVTMHSRNPAAGMHQPWQLAPPALSCQRGNT